MATFAEVLRYLTQTVFGIYIFAVLLRLLLQLARADFYNPISQFVVKLSNPLVLPLRRVIPSIGRLDSATVLLALMLQFLATIIVLGLLGVPFGTPNPLIVIVWSAVGILSLVVKVYFFAILAMIIFSWIAPHSHHPALALLHQLTEPAMAPLRRLLPPMGGLDLSPILAFVAINVLEIVLRGLAAWLGMPGGIVLGL
ncbi:MAG: YggT family protein [Gammaproteobacteria bacterium]|jgi:YggT family protein|nr:YggT family protein [Gammaproteobacteria bacterium]MBP6051408.1 YggT family protein [Pseudomonadales bacterium]MBK6582819.1 YggT family protein [Gammaproteobacteria bacterium]MBK7171311.1 YggT family protein [Gammaproteobacteria bacterium]MBK7518949.1 YggT family protein [Gammaproteobacteria bacterium]